MLRYGSFIVAAIDLVAWIPLSSACGLKEIAGIDTANGEAANGNGNGEIT